MLDEPRHILKTVSCPMLKYENASRLQDIALKYHFRQFRKLGQGIRRVGKDKIELFTSSFDEFEYIATDRDTFVSLYLLHYLADESMVVPVFFNADYAVATP